MRDGQKERQTERQTDRQSNRQPGRNTQRQTDRQREPVVGAVGGGGGGVGVHADEPLIQRVGVEGLGGQLRLRSVRTVSIEITHDDHVLAVKSINVSKPGLRFMGNCSYL